MRIEIGTKKIHTTVWKNNHIPLWNITGTQDLLLQKNLSFAPDLTINLVQKGWFGGEKDVGEINIPMTAINEDFSEPKFYQFTSYGEIKGKLLAIFNITEQDPKNLEEYVFDQAVENNSDILTHADIKMALIGIRNLVGITNDLKMEVNLLYLKPNKDSGYTAGMIKSKEYDDLDEDKEEEKEDHRKDHQRDSNLDEENSNDSYIDDEDEEMGLHAKKENLERKSVNPGLLEDVKKQNEADNKDQENDDIENNITRTGAEVPSNLGEVKTLEPIFKNPTSSPNF